MLSTWITLTYVEDKRPVLINIERAIAIESIGGGGRTRIFFSFAPHENVDVVETPEEILKASKAKA